MLMLLTGAVDVACTVLVAWMMVFFVRVFTDAVGPANRQTGRHLGSDKTKINVNVHMKKDPRAQS